MYIVTLRNITVSNCYIADSMRNQKYGLRNNIHLEEQIVSTNTCTEECHTAILMRPTQKLYMGAVECKNYLTWLKQIHVGFHG